jgi:hypothetical protein
VALSRIRLVRELLQLNAKEQARAEMNRLLNVSIEGEVEVGSFFAMDVGNMSQRLPYRLPFYVFGALVEVWFGKEGRRIWRARQLARAKSVAWNMHLAGIETALIEEAVLGSFQPRATCDWL